MAARILIVEDDVLVAMVLEDQLRDMGYDVVSSIDEAGGLSAARGRVDLAILDFHLGALSPLRLIDVLKEQGVPIIICSGSSVGSGSPIRTDLPYVAKPYSEDDIATAVRLALSASNLG